jgi:hypothetical protein
MTEPLNHKLDISKIKTLTDVKNVFECMSLYSYAERKAQYGYDRRRKRNLRTYRQIC